MMMLNSGMEFAVMSVDHGARKANSSPMIAAKAPGEYLTMMSCGRMVPVSVAAVKPSAVPSIWQSTIPTNRPVPKAPFLSGLMPREMSEMFRATVAHQLVCTAR